MNAQQLKLPSLNSNCQLFKVANKLQKLYHSYEDHFNLDFM